MAELSELKDELIAINQAMIELQTKRRECKFNMKIQSPLSIGDKVLVASMRGKNDDEEPIEEEVFISGIKVTDEGEFSYAFAQMKYDGTMSKRTYYDFWVEKIIKRIG